MSNKNPFEIRAEMLRLAKGYMDQQYHENITFMKDMYERGKKTYQEVEDAYRMYSVEDLVSKAKELYSFVSTKE